MKENFVGVSSVFVCPSQAPYNWAYYHQIYGMHVPSVGALYLSGAWRLRDPPTYNDIVVDVTKDLMSTILLVDSVEQLPGDFGHRKQHYYVSEYAFFTFVHIRHRERANAYFGDGHVESLIEPELRANLGWAEGVGIDNQVP